MSADVSWLSYVAQKEPKYQRSPPEEFSQNVSSQSKILRFNIPILLFQRWILVYQTLVYSVKLGYTQQHVKKKVQVEDNQQEKEPEKRQCQVPEVDQGKLVSYRKSCYLGGSQNIRKEQRGFQQPRPRQKYRLQNRLINCQRSDQNKNRCQHQHDQAKGNHGTQRCFEDHAHLVPWEEQEQKGKQKHQQQQQEFEKLQQDQNQAKPPPWQLQQNYQQIAERLCNNLQGQLQIVLQDQKQCQSQQQLQQQTHHLLQSQEQKKQKKKQQRQIHLQLRTRQGQSLHAKAEGSNFGAPGKHKTFGCVPGQIAFLQRLPFGGLTAVPMATAA